MAMSNSHRLRYNSLAALWLVRAPGFQKLPCSTSPELDEASVFAVDAFTILEIKGQLRTGNTSVDGW